MMNSTAIQPGDGALLRTVLTTAILTTLGLSAPAIAQSASGEDLLVEGGNLAALRLEGVGDVLGAVAVQAFEADSLVGRPAGMLPNDFGGLEYALRTISL